MNSEPHINVIKLICFVHELNKNKVLLLLSLCLYDIKLALGSRLYLTALVLRLKKKITVRTTHRPRRKKCHQLGLWLKAVLG